MRPRSSTPVARALTCERSATARSMPPPPGARPTSRSPRAVWIAERVYHNHAHWLTAHLPKLALLREMGELGDLVLPAERGAAIDASLHRLGIEPADHPQLPAGAVLAAEELTVLETDRFRPELLRPRPRRDGGPRHQAAQAALRQPPLRARPAPAGRGGAPADAGAPGLRGGRDGAAGPRRAGGADGGGSRGGGPARRGARQHPVLPPRRAGAGDRRSRLSQPQLLRDGRGLGLDYGLLAAEGVGDRHPLDQDLAVEPGALRDAVEAML